MGNTAFDFFFLGKTVSAVVSEDSSNDRKAPYVRRNGLTINNHQRTNKKPNVSLLQAAQDPCICSHQRPSWICALKASQVEGSLYADTYEPSRETETNPNPERSDVLQRYTEIVKRDQDGSLLELTHYYCRACASRVGVHAS